MELRKIETGESIPDGTVVLLVTKDSGNIIGTVRRYKGRVSLANVTGFTDNTVDAQTLIDTSDVYVLGNLLLSGSLTTLLPDTPNDLVVGDFVVDTSILVGGLPVYVVITEVLDGTGDEIKYNGVAVTAKTDESLRDTGGVNTFYMSFSEEEANKVLRRAPYKGSWFEHRETKAIGEAVLDSRRGVYKNYYLEFLDALEKVDGRED